MKSKVFKIMLPAFAILLAISLSFANEANRVSQLGYYDDPYISGIQHESTECSPNGTGSFCTTEDGYQLYDEPALQTKLRQVVP